MSERPQLTDGVVTLRTWEHDDISASLSGHDEEIAHWYGLDAAPTRAEREALVREWQEASKSGKHLAAYVVEVDGAAVGNVEVTPEGTCGGSLAWTLYAGQRGRGHATRAVRLLTDWALTSRSDGGLGLERVEARVEPGNAKSLRVAIRAGLRREGVQRVTPGMGDRAEATEYVVLSRLRTDPPLSDPSSFRSLLNASLPRKRAIGQLLVTDEQDRVLLCQLTYKRDWDLPGGVVEVEENPRTATAREVTEELGLDLPAGRLLLTDWLPPWGGWDDALCLVFDGGRQVAGMLESMVREEREIRTAEFCTREQIEERCRDFTARRIDAALASRDGRGPSYAESGRTEI